MSWLGKRPETPQSGVLLQTEYSIQHRSDHLMMEHIENIQDSQECLRRAILQLEVMKSQEDINTQHEVIQQLQAKTDKLIVVLHVLDKLNKEVAYARADLDNALYHGQGDINAARKRVIWLEDKMGELCGKRRLKSQPAVQFHLETEFIDDNGDTEQSSNDSEQPLMSDITSDRPQSDLLGMLSFRGPADLDFVSPRLRYGPAAPIEAGTLNAALKRAKALRELEKKSQMSAEREATPEPLYKHKPIIFPESETETEESESESEASYFEEGSERTEKDEESESKSSEAECSEMVKEDKTESAVDEEETKDALLVPEQSQGELPQVSAEDKTKLAQTFLTEVSTPKSRVTIATPTEEKNKPESVAVQQEASEDMADEYWSTEHHRFEQTAFAELMQDLDPLSYNTVGLALPGSFIRRDNTQFEELPFRPHRKSSDIKDIHRIALEKLALKVHGMREKLYSAAMLSVNPSQPKTEMPRETSFLQSVDSQLSSKQALSKLADLLPPRSETPRPLTVDTVQLPKLEAKRIGTSGSGRLVYYPKPIPPPEVLPITRTNKNKEFPKLTSFYSDPVLCQTEPAVRIVDQRNLQEETKLVLYKEKPKSLPRGPSVHERRFRRMLERDKTASTKASSKKLKKTFNMAATIAKLQGGISAWGKIKPKSHGNEFAGLRWERVKTIVHVNLVSPREEERKDAAKQLGMLRCGDTMVFFALKERLHKDVDDRVRYESAKSLILLGCWEEEVLQVILKYLVIGNTEIRQDLIKTMIRGKNVQYVDKNIPTFPEMVKLLSHFCRNPDPEDPIAFEAAVLLGKLCVSDSNAREKLKKSISESSNSHTKAKAVEILVKQMNCTDQDVVSSIQDILQTSVVWKHRQLAAKLLISLGPGHQCVKQDHEGIYQLLERRLWDEPSMDVRTSAAKALTALGMFARACETMEKRLEDQDEDARAQAAVAVGTLGMKTEKLTRLMLEMLELDSSDYVRLMIIRSFATLKLVDRRVLRTLHEREKMEGPLARESKKTLRLLEEVVASGSRSITPKTLTPATPHRKTTIQSLPIKAA